VEVSDNIDGNVVEVKKDFFTISNMVSISRMIVPIPLALLGPPDGRPETLFTLLVAWAIISDYLDGYLARLLNQRSEFGKIIDPIADKVCAILLFLFAVWVDRIPLWFLLVVITRDVLILLGSYIIIKQHRKVAMSVMSGKITVNLLALLWIVVMYFPDHAIWETVLLSISTAMMVYSTAEYAWRYRKIRIGARFN